MPPSSHQNWKCEKNKGTNFSCCCCWNFFCVVFILFCFSKIYSTWFGLSSSSHHMIWFSRIEKFVFCTSAWSVLDTEEKNWTSSIESGRSAIIDCTKSLSWLKTTVVMMMMARCWRCCWCADKSTENNIQSKRVVDCPLMLSFITFFLYQHFWLKETYWKTGCSYWRLKNRHCPKFYYNLPTCCELWVLLSSWEPLKAFLCTEYQDWTTDRILTHTFCMID